MLALGFLSIHLFHGIVDASGIFYEDITAPDCQIINGGSIKRTSIIHKSFHQCSMSETCNFVINNIASGNFNLYNKEDDLPVNKTGLRIWKKIDYGPFKDCRDAYKRGNRTNGVFAITIPVIGLSNVRCDMTTPHGGWVVIQRRIDATLDFYRTWEEYKEGFGDLNGNFWLGLAKIHQLAAPGKGTALRIDLKHMDYPGEKRYAKYNIFAISDETDGYRITIGGYSGNAGDSLTSLNKMPFSTKDRNNLRSKSNCAVVDNGAWWYKNCSGSNLNGIFPQDDREESVFISWNSWTGSNGRIVFSEMKIQF